MAQAKPEFIVIQQLIETTTKLEEEPDITPESPGHRQARRVEDRLTPKQCGSDEFRAIMADIWL